MKIIHRAGVRTSPCCACLLWRPLHLTEHKIMEHCGKVRILMVLGTNGSLKPRVPLAYTSLSRSCSHKWDHTDLVTHGSGSSCRTQFPHFQNALPEALKPLLHLCPSCRVSAELSPPKMGCHTGKAHLHKSVSSKTGCILMGETLRIQQLLPEPLQGCQDGSAGDREFSWTRLVHGSSFVQSTSMHPCWADPLLPVPSLPHCPWFLCDHNPLHTFLVSADTGGQI